MRKLAKIKSMDGKVRLIAIPVSKSWNVQSFVQSSPSFYDFSYLYIVFLYSLFCAVILRLIRDHKNFIR